MSEKLDGVRAWWDGRQFISRQGNAYCAPDWFVAGLPNIPLDGELWLGRKAFQRTVSIVCRGDESDSWRHIRFMVFDAPTATGQFEARQAFLRKMFNRNSWPYAAHVQQNKCRSDRHLRTELTRIESIGGEGLMLREPGSLYASGRSSTLLKLKSFHDAEGWVIDHLPGQGRNVNRLGAVVVALPNGLTFSIGAGFSDVQRQSPPVIGSVVTFQYQELTDHGIPRFPSFLRSRTDVTNITQECCV